MTRRIKSATELASDLGAKAADLQSAYDDPTVLSALRVLVKVNPELFAWLRDRLVDVIGEKR